MCKKIWSKEIPGNFTNVLDGYIYRITTETNSVVDATLFFVTFVLVNKVLFHVRCHKLKLAHFATIMKTVNHLFFWSFNSLIRLFLAWGQNQMIWNGATFSQFSITLKHAITGTQRVPHSKLIALNLNSSKEYRKSYVGIDLKQFVKREFL